MESLIIEDYDPNKEYKKGEFVQFFNSVYCYISETAGNCLPIRIINITLGEFTYNNEAAVRSLETSFGMEADDPNDPKWLIIN